MKYENPLINRYASDDMSKLFSEEEKVICWRRLWVALAEAEQELGLDITDRQIQEMKNHIEDLNLDIAHEREKEVRHDVMAQVYAFGQQCPLASPIIHLGATSCYVGDNADLIAYYKALFMIKRKIVAVLSKLKTFAENYKDLATLGFTHLQPAQPTTVGKRATLWMQDLIFDYYNIDNILNNYKLRGVKGTTGTQSSFCELFDGDFKKVQELDKIVCKKLGFDNKYTVTGQTYPRKFDYTILSALSSVAQSTMKFATDIRILQSKKEIEEPFSKNQIGSSAMAYKRNPMRSERICALSKYVISLPVNAAITAGTQWFERTLDDSANRRIVLPEAFMAVDGILGLCINVAENLVVYPNVIKKHLDNELPFMATENILMECVKEGGDRQKLHEKIRVHSMEAAKIIKEDGGDNDLIERIIADEDFSAIKDKINDIINIKNFVGFAPQQVDYFIEKEVNPIIDKNPEATKIVAEINV